jgi:hypothetical protein
LLFSPKQSAAMRLINSHHTALGTGRASGFLPGGRVNT